MENIKDRNLPLLKKYKCSKTQEDFNKVFNANVRLIYFINNKYFSGYSIPQDELYSIGSVALYKAIEMFDINDGAMFSSYASKSIYYAIVSYLKQQEKSSKDISINTPIGNDSEDDYSLLDTLVDDGPSPEEIYENKELETLFLMAFSYLSDRSRQIISMRYGINTKEKNITEIAKELGLSRSYVNQTIKVALRKLKKIINVENNGLASIKSNAIRISDYNKMTEEQKDRAEEYMVLLRTSFSCENKKSFSAIGKMFNLKSREVELIVSRRIKRNAEEKMKQRIMQMEGK